MADKTPVLTDEEIWELDQPTWDMSFIDDYRQEVNAIMTACIEQGRQMEREKPNYYDLLCIRCKGVIDGTVKSV